MVIFENIQIDKAFLKNIDIDIDKEILEDIDINIDKEILENINIDIIKHQGLVFCSIAATASSEIFPSQTSISLAIPRAECLISEDKILQ